MSASLFYVGTYTHTDPAAPRTEGVYLCQIDEKTGALKPLRAEQAGPNPSFITLDASRRFLYAVNELRTFEGQRGGAVSAFAVEADGGLRFLNRFSTAGEDPCFVSLDSQRRWVMAANYSGGSLALYPLAADGSLRPMADFLQYSGVGYNPAQQEMPHSHSIQMDPQERFVLATDLGLDRINVFTLDAAAGKLREHSPAYAPAQPGAGPRHLVFHPNQRFVYVANELNSTVAAYAWDAAGGHLTPLQSLAINLEGFSGANYMADLHFHPSGRFLYATSRGANTIETFAVDAATGLLTQIGHTPCGGAWPRNFALHPSGNWLLVANQHTANVVCFSVHPETGALSPAGHELSLPYPVCVQFV